MVMPIGPFLKKWLTVAAALCLMLVSGCVARKPTSNSLIIQRPAYFKAGAKIDGKIRDECGLEKNLPVYVKKYARGRYDAVFLSDTLSAETPAKVLVLKIAHAEALGNRTSLTVEGTLTQNGKVIGNFVDYRGTRKNGRSCRLLSVKFANRIGKDVGKWLRRPTMNALLGTAKKMKLSTPQAADEEDSDEKDEDEK